MVAGPPARAGISPANTFDPTGPGKRWRPFVGIDLGYVPDVDLGDVRVNYPGGIPSETVSATGSAYFTIAPVVGASFLWSDSITVDMGAFYEWPLGESEESVRFENLGGAEADVRVEPEGLIVAAGVTWHF